MMIPEGWEIRTEPFNLYEGKWGVAVQSREPIAGKFRRFAVHARGANEGQAVVDAAAQLTDWIASEGWHTRKCQTA